MSLRPDQRRAWLREMASARRAERRRQPEVAFAHLERAHIIGQRDTVAHTAAHVAMLRFGVRHHDLREVAGQLVRIPAAITKSRVWVPQGNTGGARVSPLKPMPVPHDLARYVD